MDPSDLKFTTRHFLTCWSQLDCSALALPVCLLSEVVSCMFIQSCGGKPGRDRERRKTEAKTTFQFVWTRRQCELEEIGSVKDVLLLVPIGYLFLGHSGVEEGWRRRWSSAVGSLLKSESEKCFSGSSHVDHRSETVESRGNRLLNQLTNKPHPFQKRKQTIKQICIFQWTEMWTIWLFMTIWSTASIWAFVFYR